ncbi:hypothetical protein RGQ13_11225 [Thalassotalea psychrophila]|uniref:Lipoprotein n=1 Tax=Thalassotalea psychrophila TaxID=3065647 RepID=A0ABY9TQK0_9GAMM|nr:hypothetical protein RGQ13_11225 [Colwelliaceae bacterium SQ149]
MIKTIKNLTLIITFGWLSGCAQTTVRHHQDFEEIAKTIDSVVIIPADIEITLLTLVGPNEVMEEEQKTIREQINSLAAKRITEENLELIDFNFTKEKDRDLDFSIALTQAKKAWNSAKRDMYQTQQIDEKDKAKFRTNLGSVLKFIGDKTDADAALLLHYRAYEDSAGVIAARVAAKTADVLISILTFDPKDIGKDKLRLSDFSDLSVEDDTSDGTTFLDVALVEIATGKVIWANRKSGTSIDIGPVDKAFKELPDLTWKTELTQNEQPTTSLNNGTGTTGKGLDVKGADPEA